MDHVWASHTRTDISQVPLTICRPFGENATPRTSPALPRRTANSCPVLASHTRIVSSVDPLTIRLPSGEKATLVTSCVCPRRTASSALVTASQTRTVRSSCVTSSEPCEPGRETMGGRGGRHARLSARRWSNCLARVRGCVVPFCGQRIASNVVGGAWPL